MQSAPKDNTNVLMVHVGIAILQVSITVLARVEQAKAGKGAESHLALHTNYSGSLVVASVATVSTAMKII